MANIYTKTGDAGETCLWDGSKVAKNDPHIELNGTLDELNAALGMARAVACPEMKACLNDLQSELTNLMAYVARGARAQDAPCAEPLERRIDEIFARYPMAHHFVNPGESPAGAALHLARAIARRAERVALPIHATNGGDIEPAACRYLNRLSDLLFALAHQADAIEIENKK